MLFNSYIFIFLFLPVTLIGFHLIGSKCNYKIAISWLVGASLFFYGWWNPAYLGLILASIIFNYSMGLYLENKSSKVSLFFGIAGNIGLLAYFKYANFFVDNFNILVNGEIYLENIILPLAISFFTFQQITYLIDAHRGLTKEYSFLHYCLFVTFFPQLIAGPIVHHREMLPQFLNANLYKLKASNLVVGLTIFSLGLFKKVVFADSIALYASPVFDAAGSGVALTFFEAWGGALAFTFQLYFDFSGYSDMAIGIARMFGILLPLNFYSPYKANNIIEFWRRWHITLSNFLRDYLYIPLGGNRKGNISRAKNVMITMLLAGFWHGAGWTFIIWGGMHGAFLIVNHTWIKFHNKFCVSQSKKCFIKNASSRLITFTVVVIAWVMFRAENLDAAMNMYSSMFGFNGISLPIGIEDKLGSLADITKEYGFVYQGMFYNGVFGDGLSGMLLLFTMLLIVWFFPNTLDFLRNENPALGFDAYKKGNKTNFVWRPNYIYMLGMAIVAIIAVMFIQQESEFLYFQF